MKLALSMEGELEDCMEAPDWYSSLTGEAKTEADSLLAQMGKVSVLVYGRYSQYDERMENFVNEHLKQKKPGIRAGGYLLYGAAGQEYALCLLSAGASGSQRQARLYWLLQDTGGGAHAVRGFPPVQRRSGNRTGQLRVL